MLFPFRPAHTLGLPSCLPRPPPLLFPRSTCLGAAFRDIPVGTCTYVTRAPFVANKAAFRGGTYRSSRRVGRHARAVWE